MFFSIFPNLQLMLINRLFVFQGLILHVQKTANAPAAQQKISKRTCFNHIFYSVHIVGYSKKEWLFYFNIYLNIF